MSNTHPYSGDTPIPKIGDFLEEQRRQFGGSEAHSHEAQKQEQPAGQPGGHIDEPRDGRTTTANAHPSVGGQTKQLKHGQGVGKGNRRTVRDPTTGNQVEIEDVSADFKEAAENPELVVPRSALPDDIVNERDFAGPTQSIEEYSEKQDVTAPPAPVKPGATTDIPIRGEKTDILFHATPTLSLSDTVFAGFEQKATVLCTGIFATIVVLGKMISGGSIWALLFLGAGVSGGVWYWCRGVMEEARNVDWESEKKRGEIAVSNRIPESVEWMNSLVGLIWSLVDPEIFSALADTFEDVMQASLPSLIENVRVVELSQGSNPIRILSLRALLDSEVPDLKRSASVAKDGMDEHQRMAEEDGGEVYNLEVSFAYNAAPIESKTLSGKTRNMHMQIIFYAGIPGLVGVPLPIWVGLKGLIGTVRLRVQLSPESPFLKTLTFTLMGIPQVSVSCIPMVERGINVLNLPMISNFVNASISTAANEYVAPKSMSLEIGKMLMSDDVKKETEALGILWVNIERAVGLSKQDISGSSDAYITLAFSKYGKPMYSTRVIVDDLNPIWNESTGILIRSEHIKAGEALSVELWDSDRFTADDLVGKCELSIQDLMVHSGEKQNRVSKLRSQESGSEMPGELHWSVTFFGRTDFRPTLRTSGKDVNLPPELIDHPGLQDDKGSLDTAKEDAVIHTPPDPLFPSGIVSVIVHQIVNLELRDMTGTFGKRKDGKEYSPGMKTGENSQEEGGKLPSSYCTITLNDQLIYRTRSKVLSSKPIFNAGTEHFIRDWRSAIVTVTVRDQRQREHDPLLGVVSLKLSGLLQTGSEVTRWFPLDGGLGFGQIRISILFRSLGLSLPPQLLGWEVGTFEFLSESITATLDKPAKLKLRTGGSTGKIPRKNCHTSAAGGVEWNTTVGSKHPKKVRLPVKHRYMSPICIDMFTSSNSRKPDAHAMVWLDKLIDNERTAVTIPVWTTNNPQRLSQNYIERPGTHPDLEVSEIGTMVFEARFQPGMDPDHARFATDNDLRETFETWEACRGEGIRSDTVYTETNPVVDELHKKSIREMRNDLVQTDKGLLVGDDAKKYTDKYGMDWQQVFELGQEQLRTERNKPLPHPPAGEHIYHRHNHHVYDSDSDTFHSNDEDEHEDSDDSYHRATTPQHYEPLGQTETAADDQNKGSGPIASSKNYRANQKSMHRRQRGLMQWKPMRTLAFAKDEASYGARKLKGKFKLTGREPDVETEV